MDGFEYGQSFKWLLWFLLLEYGFMATLLEPGFLDFDNLPDTNFTCVGKVIGGYYADLETACQMFHVCTIGQLDEPMDIRFLCLNGTVFDQETRVCERIDEVDCAQSEQFYSLNLELYGNTQPPILSESEELDGPSSTATSQTSSASSEAKVTRQSFIITTAKPTRSTDLYKPHTTQRPTTTLRYQIPLNRPPDIRFNPKEINVSLSGGDSDDSGDTDDSEPYHDRYHGTSSTERFIEHTTQKAPTKIVRNNNPVVKPTIRSTTTTEQYETEGYVDLQKEPPNRPLLRNNYQYRLNVPNFRPSAAGLLRHHHHHQQNTNKYNHQPSNRPSIFYSQPKTQQQQQYSSPPIKNHHQRLSVLHPSQSYYNNYKHEYFQTDVSPVKIQLELPTRQPLTFSSPSPFKLSPHRQQQQQQQTRKHRNYGHQSPRIVISASASVSDASGRKFNYSLGTIGDSQLFGHAPQSYDDYREEDVGFDPFYHDVLKINRAGRRKREVLASSTDAIDTLRFLFEWYNRHKTPQGEDDINTRWNSSVRNEYNARNDDVIYKSVIDTIKQEVPSSKTSNLEEYQHYAKEDFLRATERNDASNFDTDSTIGMSNNYEEDYEEVSFANIEPNKTLTEIVLQDPLEDFTTFPNFEDQEDIVDPSNRNEYLDHYEEDIDPLINHDYIPQNYELKFESKPFSTSHFLESNQSDKLPNAVDIIMESTTHVNEFNRPSEDTRQNFITTASSTELNDHGFDITDRYLHVLNILGITTVNQTTTPLESTTRISEDVLDIPVNTPQATEPMESSSVTTETNLPTSQMYTTTEGIEPATIDSARNKGVSTIIFGAKLKIDRSTTLEPMAYTEETSLQDVLTVTTASSTLNDKTLGTQSVQTSTPLMETTPTSVIPTTILVTQKPSTESIFRVNSNHRFNRFRSNTRSSKPPRYTTTIKAITTLDETLLTSSLPKSTTPSYVEPNPKLVSQTYAVQVDSKQYPKGKSVDMSNRTGTRTNYIFNCFGKDLNQFYSDPRDCRLFHYCTNGYTSTQLLDMKFVCDSGTYFDSEKLVCTKIKPLRCI